MAIKAAKSKQDKAETKEPAEKKKSDGVAKMVPQTRDQLVNELIDNHMKAAKVENQIVEAEADLKELKTEKTKLESRQKVVMDNLSSGQLTIGASDSSDSVMDKSNYKTAEELKRHPQAEEGSEEGTGGTGA